MPFINCSNCLNRYDNCDGDNCFYPEFEYFKIDRILFNDFYGKYPEKITRFDNINIDVYNRLVSEGFTNDNPDTENKTLIPKELMPEDKPKKKTIFKRLKLKRQDVNRELFGDD